MALPRNQAVGQDQPCGGFDIIRQHVIAALNGRARLTGGVAPTGLGRFLSMIRQTARDAAREVLLTALDIVDDRTRAHTVQRLRTIARSMGDELELRRTRGRGNATITTLGTMSSRRVPLSESRVDRLRRRRAALAG